MDCKFRALGDPESRILDFPSISPPIVIAIESSRTKKKSKLMPAGFGSAADPGWLIPHSDRNMGERPESRGRTDQGATRTRTRSSPPVPRIARLAGGLVEQRDPSFSEMSTAAAPVAGQRPKGEMVRATVTFEMEFELLVLASGVIPHSPEAHSWCSSGDWTGPKGASAWESPKTGATRSTTSGIMVPPPTRPQRVIWHSPESFLGFLDSWILQKSYGTPSKTPPCGMGD